MTTGAVHVAGGMTLHLKTLQKIQHNKRLTVDASSGRVFPFVLGGQTLAGPRAEGERVDVADVYDGIGS